MREGASQKGLSAAPAGQTVSFINGQHRIRGDDTQPQGAGLPRPRVPAVLLDRRRRSVRPSRMGIARRDHRQRKGHRCLRTTRGGNAEVLVATGDQHRCLKIFPGARRIARARTLGQAAHRPRRQHDHRLGAQAEVLRVGSGAVGVQRRSEVPARAPEGGVQQPGLVQLRLRKGAAVLGVLHQLRRRHDGVDPRRWPRPRACCSSSAPAPAATSRRFARRRSCSPAAAPRPARSRS